MGCPVRILHVVVNMNRGGAETLIMNLYRNIDRSQVQFDFLTCKEGVFDSEIKEMGGIVHRIPYVSDVGHGGYIKALDHFFGSHPEYKIVHSHMDKMSGYVLRAAQRAGVSTRIAHGHSTSSEGGLAVKTYKWLAGKFILPSATDLLACSNAAAKWLFSGKAEKAVVLKNGIECDRFKFSPEIRKQVKQELQICQDSLVVGHVGRFSHPKNHAFLIDIFVHFNKHNPDSVLVLVGDGPLRLEIEQKVRELNLNDKVRFLGIRSDIHRLLQALDVFVFPSWYEGLPVSLIEAQGAGLPCVISDVITQEVDMGTGLLYLESLKSSPIVWANKLSSIWNRRLDDVSVSIIEKGYDIRSSTQWLQKFYLNKLKEYRNAKSIMSN